MAKVTPKENFMMLRHGGHPEYVPVYTMMGTPYEGEVADKMMMAPLYDNNSFVDGGYDMWGVKYVAAEGTNNATMPDTSIIMLEDPADWKEVIRFPEMPVVNWEEKYEADMKAFGVDREQNAVMVSPGLMPFQELVGLMGFAGALMALYDDPESVLEMLNAMVDFIEPVYTKMIDVYKPDLWYILDDSCAKTQPFFSVETYREVFKPIYERLAKPANDRGIPIIFHNCGFVEPFIPEMLDFGVKILEPMQNSNDINKCKKLYGDRMAFIGGADWSAMMPKNYPDFDEEELRQSVRDILDAYSEDGGYGFYAWPISYPGDPVIGEVNRIIRDEAHFYGRKIYGYEE